MDRMSAQDATFLYIEDARNPMHIGNVSVFEGPAPAYGDLVRAVAAKLPHLPRYRQRAHFVPLGLGRPVWADDPHFNILYHVRHTAVPAPGGREEVRNLAGRLFAQNLDRGRPLWELWLVEGVQHAGWALVSKVHHAMVDGVSGAELLSVLLDRNPETTSPVPDGWQASGEPGAARLLADALVDAVTDPLGRLRALPALPRIARTRMAGGLPARETMRLASSLRHWGQRSVGSLNGPIGPHRRWSWAEGSLADVRDIRQSLGGTVNDVVLATITRGFRDLLVARGEDLENRVVRTLVPVSVRGEHERGTLNNRVSGLFPGLPVGEPDPLRRLQLIRDQLDGLKQSGQAMSGDALIRLSGFAPPMLLSLGARLGTHFHQRLIQTVTTNVPGPQHPLYLLGRRMRFAYPYVPIGGTVRIGVAIFSYDGALYYGVTGDYDTVPDLDVLASGIEAGMAELLRLAGRPSPDAGDGAHPRRTRRVTGPTRSKRRATAPATRAGTRTRR